MIVFRKSNERGQVNFGWLQSRHTFSFGEYYDPQHMGFGPLRVINEDVIAGGSGFPTHPHREMEIITYVVQGAVEHKDSSGGVGVIKPNEVQLMSAGHWVQHSEYNHYKDQPTHLLQIWIMPNQFGGEATYQQKLFLSEEERVLLVSQNGENGSLKILQDAQLWRVKTKGFQVFDLKENRRYWFQIIEGEVTVGEQKLVPGDAFAIVNQNRIEFEATQKSHFLFFDLPN